MSDYASDAGFSVGCTMIIMFVLFAFAGGVAVGHWCW